MKKVRIKNKLKLKKLKYLKKLEKVFKKSFFEFLFVIKKFAYIALAETSSGACTERAVRQLLQRRFLHHLFGKRKLSLKIVLFCELKD